MLTLKYIIICWIEVSRSSIRYYISHDSFYKDLVILVSNKFVFLLLKFFTSHAIIQMLTAYWTANAHLRYNSGQKQVTRNQTTGTCTYTIEKKRVLIIFPFCICIIYHCNNIIVCQHISVYLNLTYTDTITGRNSYFWFIQHLFSKLLLTTQKQTYFDFTKLKHHILLTLSLSILVWWRQYLKCHVSNHQWSLYILLPNEEFSCRSAMFTWLSVTCNYTLMRLWNTVFEY